MMTGQDLHHTTQEGLSVELTKMLWVHDRTLGQAHEANERLIEWAIERAGPAGRIIVLETVRLLTEGYTR